MHSMADTSLPADRGERLTTEQVEAIERRYLLGVQTVAIIREDLGDLLADRDRLSTALTTTQKELGEAQARIETDARMIATAGEEHKRLANVIADCGDELTALETENEELKKQTASLSARIVELEGALRHCRDGTAPGTCEEHYKNWIDAILSSPHPGGSDPITQCDRCERPVPRSDTILIDRPDADCSEVVCSKCLNSRDRGNEHR